MSQAPAMPMYWDAYLADTTHLSAEEHGAYLLLMAAMWRRNGFVPDDDVDNARILKVSKGKWRKIKTRLDPFLEYTAQGITQKKLQKTWIRTQEIIAKNRLNGAKGGRPKMNENKDLEKPNGLVWDSQLGTPPEPEPELTIDTDVSIGALNKTAPRPKKKNKPRTLLPEEWELPQDQDDARGWFALAVKNGVPESEIERQGQQFKNHHVAKGNLMVNWKAAWGTWTGNYQDFKPRGAGNGATIYSTQQGGTQQQGGHSSASESQSTHLRAIYESSSPERGDQLANEDRHVQRY
ncbi:MAG: DUF1376 domain-containing protein [Kordiimonadaceae bacterium]|nr:DUF1376 domain-containing protein [Kordiimonadaceae bacterium]